MKRKRWKLKADMRIITHFDMGQIALPVVLRWCLTNFERSLTIEIFIFRFSLGMILNYRPGGCPVSGG